MVNVGILGIGFMGMTHFKALQKVKGGRVTAISTRSAKKLAGDWRDIQGNFGDSGGVQDLSRVAKHPNLEDLLEDDTVDLVDICLPTYMHRDVTIAALKKGKHVLVEKPIALTLKDADAMIAAATKADRLLMVGQVLRFFPAFTQAREIVLSGKYGELLGAHFKRVISLPSWGADDHFTDPSKSGGASIDLHIHDTDFVHYLAGVPNQVQASGVCGRGNMITYLQTHYLYEGGRPCITCQSGAIAMSTLMFEHGYDVYLENATLQYDNLFTGEDIWLYTSKGKKLVRPKGKDPFVAELQHAVDCIAAGKESDIISGASAREALRVCLKEQQAALTRKPVRVGT